MCLAVYLGAATNNEAEIAASLLGFSALRALHGDSTPVSVHWVSDSEYVLKSATAYIRNWQRNGWQTADKKPVKNQGLWRAYLALTHSFKIKAEHVKGHSGHPENEACDQASLWARNFADEFDAGKSWVREDLDTPIGTDCWTCFDGRVLLEGVRSESPSEEQNLELVRLLGEFFRSKDNESDQQAPNRSRSVRCLVSSNRQNLPPAACLPVRRKRVISKSRSAPICYESETYPSTACCKHHHAPCYAVSVVRKSVL